MGIVQWFKRLKRLNKLCVVGSVASIIGIPIALYSCGRSATPTSNVAQAVSSPNVSQSVTVNVPAPKTSLHDRHASVLFSKIEEIRQPVNKKIDFRGIHQDLGKEETATFRFVLSNHSNDIIDVSRGELLVDRVERKEGLTATLLTIPSLDHKGHVPVVLENPGVGDCVPIDLSFRVAPQSIKEFTLWFRSRLPDVSILCLGGRLRLQYVNGSVTSDPIRIEIHSDSFIQPLPELTPLLTR